MTDDFKILGQLAGDNDERLESVYGRDPLWQKIKKNDEAKRALNQWLDIRAEMEAGNTPQAFKFEAYCDNCGKVYLHTPFEKVKGCAWCFIKKEVLK